MAFDDRLIAKAIKYVCFVFSGTRSTMRSFWKIASSLYSSAKLPQHSPTLPPVELLESRVLMSASLLALPTPIVSKNSYSYGVSISPADAETPLGSVPITGSPALPNQALGIYGLFGPYNIDKSTFGSSDSIENGNGETIAIIVAFDDPTLQSDVNVFDQQFDLPAITITKLNQSGSASPLPQTSPSNDDWSHEESLDVEYAHAVAPAANITVFEADGDGFNSNGVPYLLRAARAAALTSGVDVVSMSWGLNITIGSNVYGELSSETSWDSYFQPAGNPPITFVAASGDIGIVEYPSSSPDVLAVGGTTLTPAIGGADVIQPSLSQGGTITSADTYASGGYGVETGWTGSGGGASAYEPQPSYQTTVNPGQAYRTTPDVAFDANTPVWVYDTTNEDANNDVWYGDGGTSVGAPVWAGIIAQADQGRALANLGGLNQSTLMTDLYNLNGSTSFHDVTSGANATVGYDLSTGLGTPNVNQLLKELGAARNTAPFHNAPSAIGNVSVNSGNLQWNMPINQGSPAGSFLSYTFGQSGDDAVVGKWTASGPESMGVFNPTTAQWTLDTNGDGLLDSGDATFTFGTAGASQDPIAGNWNGNSNGVTYVGVFTPGTGYFDLDSNGDQTQDAGDANFQYLSPGSGLYDQPVVGNWNGGSITEIGVLRNNQNNHTQSFYLDSNNNYVYDAGVDPIVQPEPNGINTGGGITGDWNGDGIADIGVYNIVPRVNNADLFELNSSSQIIASAYYVQYAYSGVPQPIVA